MEKNLTPQPQTDFTGVSLFFLLLNLNPSGASVTSVAKMSLGFNSFNRGK
jgi:hypothetical protein